MRPSLPRLSADGTRDKASGTYPGILKNFSKFWSRDDYLLINFVAAPANHRSLTLPPYLKKIKHWLYIVRQRLLALWGPGTRGERQPTSLLSLRFIRDETGWQKVLLFREY
jgi:hypothetical protein